MTINYPEWVLKHKTLGTAIVRNKNNFYLYKISSKWNKEKGRAQKVTEKYLGKITPEGIVAPKIKPDNISGILAGNIMIKEAGATKLLQFIGSDIINSLRSIFPQDYQQIIVLAFLRIIHTATFKNMALLYENSYLSNQYLDVSLSSKSISDFLKNIGSRRNDILNFMRQFQTGKYVIFDATNIFSQSEQMQINHLGYNGDNKFDPQVNLMYSFNAADKSPAYYRIIPGNIREISAFKLSVEELGLSNTLIIADKGFSSETNINFLEDEGLNYIIPLRRNNNLIKYKRFADENYFIFKGRPIWFYSYYKEKRRIIVYLDEHLKTDETKVYLNLLEDNYEEHSLVEFKTKRTKFGTFAVITNTQLTEKEAYEHYKSRLEIETMFDALKNTLEADKTHMQGQIQLEAWFFINHIALQLYYRIFNLLKQNELLSKYSPQDLLLHLSQIKTIKLNGVWKLAEVNSRVRKIINKIKLDDILLNF
jgi:transposase